MVRRQTLILAIGAASLWLGGTSSALADAPVDTVELPPANNGNELTLAVDGDTMVLGAYRENDSSGAVYVYRRVSRSWSLEQKLTPSDPQNPHLFGQGVDIEGDTLVVGAPLDNDTGPSTGAVYVFTRTAGVWSEQSELYGSGSVGEVVDISGNTIAASAQFNNARGFSYPYHGAAYVWTGADSSWSLQQVVIPDNVARGDHFSRDLALDGDRLLARSRGSDQTYIFERSAGVWTETAKLELVSPAGSGSGFAVALDQDTALISHGSSAEVFVRGVSSWEHQARLVGSINAERVALEGDLALLADPFAAAPLERSGAFEIFRRAGSSWASQSVVGSPSPQTYGLLGWDVAIWTGKGTIAAPGEGRGKAHTFVLTDHAHYCSGLEVTIEGTPLSETLVGTAGSDVIHGFDGNDVIDGKGGNDVVCGGPGRDMLRGGPGADLLLGQGGNDRFPGDPGHDTVVGGSGTDILDFSAATSGVQVNLTTGTSTGAGNDKVSGIENVLGSRFGDEIIGNSAKNRLVGRSGPDFLNGGGGPDTVIGGTGKDRLLGGPGNDVLRGGGAYDVLSGGLGDDVIDGGTGTDAVSFTDVNRAVTVDLDGGDACVPFGCYHAGEATGHGTDVIISVLDIQGSRAADKLVGNAAANLILGGAGNDQIEGEGGNDTLDGQDGDDLLDGGPDNDLLLGGQGADQLFGRSGNDEIHGERGADRLVGDAGTDLLVGGPDADKLVGNDGDDVLYGGGGSDELVGGRDEDVLRGGTGNDTMLGGDHEDILFGDSGDDLLRGGAQADVLIGGAGNDSLNGQSGADVAVYAFASQGVTVSLSSGTASGEGRDTLLGIPNVVGSDFADSLTGNSSANWMSGLRGNDVLKGGAGPDGLFGDAGDDRLFGQSGDDWLDGGAGKDTLDGGTGVDVCVAGESNSACDETMASGFSSTTEPNELLEMLQRLVHNGAVDEESYPRDDLDVGVLLYD